MRCRLPNNTFEAVSEPVSATPSQPSRVPKNGYSIPVRAYAIQSLRVLAREADRAVAHQKSGDDRGEKNSCAGGGEPIQKENRGFRRRLHNYRWNSQRLIVQIRDRNSWTRNVIEKCLCRR